VGVQDSDESIKVITSGRRRRCQLASYKQGHRVQLILAVVRERGPRAWKWTDRGQQAAAKACQRRSGFSWYFLVLLCFKQVS